MAVDKKFFVDINLQGNALKDAVIGSNSKMGTAGSFRFDGTRLEYFDGSSVQSVANLADISAVTGGLILQGGYDAATNTPDIADGNASKGFFWVVTAAGSFLGESVQVGDSIIAKVDEAGASIGDWLILQGNVVIATDSVDGIVRLATQAEVDAGTQGGAVVLTPATFENSSQLANVRGDITNLQNDKLNLLGGTMQGDIDMGGNRLVGAQLDDATLGTSLNALNANTIINLPAPTDSGDAANKQYVDDQAAAAQAAAEATASADATAKADAAQAAAESFATTAANQALTDANSYTDSGLAQKLSLSGGTMTGNLDMGGNSIENIDSVSTSNLNLNNGSIVNVAAPTADGQATNKLYVDDQAAAAQAAAEATASADATAKADAAQAAANSYTDGQIATVNNDKLSRDGSQAMEGNLDMGGNDITNINDIAAGSLSGIAGQNINLINNINASNASTIINLPTPISGADAANKTYVDDQAAAAQAAAESFATTAANNAQAAAEATASADATAKANAAQAAAESFATTAANQALTDANSYTDTQIDAQSFSANYDDVIWGLSGGVYTLSVAHNVNTSTPKVASYVSGNLVEFAVVVIDANTIELKSNIAPPATVLVGVSK